MTADQSALDILERRGVITRDPSESEQCCGLERDADGFCLHRPGHPVYVPERSKNGG